MVPDETVVRPWPAVAAIFVRRRAVGCARASTGLNIVRWPGGPLAIDVVDESSVINLGPPPEGAYQKTILEKQTGERELFKWDQYEVEGRRAVAYMRVAWLFGADTPNTRVVEYAGRIGTAMEWRDALSESTMTHEGVPVTDKDNYARTRSLIDIVDVIFDPYDRWQGQDFGSGNRLVDPMDSHCIAVDNDHLFRGTAADIEPGLTIDRISAGIIRRLHLQPQLLANLVGDLLTGDEMHFAQRRIDLLHRHVQQRGVE